METDEVMPDELSASQVRGALGVLIHNETVTRNDVLSLRARVYELENRVAMNEFVIGATYLAVLIVAWQVGKVAKGASVS